MPNMEQSPIDTTVLDYQPTDMQTPVNPGFDDMPGELPQPSWKKVGRVWHIVLTDGITSPAVGDSFFSFTVPSFLDGARIVKVEAAVTDTSASGGPILIQLAIGANDLLLTRINIDDTEKTSMTAATQPVINDLYRVLRTGDQIDVDIDDIGDGTAYGWQLFIYTQ